MKNFPIDFIRQIIAQTLYEEHCKNPTKYFGGDNQVNLFSFYEQLQKEEEVNRYVEIYRDLTEQQNRTGLIMNGTIIAPENPTITNIHEVSVIPMSFTCSFRVKLADRDMAIDTINNVISVLKGRKHDIAEFSSGKLLKVGTIANNVSGNPKMSKGDYVGETPYPSPTTLQIVSILSAVTTQGTTSTVISNTLESGDYFYLECAYRLKAILKTVGENNVLTYSIITSQSQCPEAIIPPDESFEKYKVSISFDSIRCDEPRNLNANEYCVISFGGSATLVDKDVALGNDMTKMSIVKKSIMGNPSITIGSTKQWLEPLELPHSLNIDNMVNQLNSNKFLNNTHTDSITLTNRYTFLVDKSITILKEWFNYSRYGTQADLTTIATTKLGITPNMIYTIEEIYSSWGEIEINSFNAKIIENIEVDNTESDTLTIIIPFQIQGGE